MLLQLEPICSRFLPFALGVIAASAFTAAAAGDSTQLSAAAGEMRGGAHALMPSTRRSEFRCMSPGAGGAGGMSGLRGATLCLVALRGGGKNKNRGHHGEDGGEGHKDKLGGEHVYDAAEELKEKLRAARESVAMQVCLECIFWPPEQERRIEREPQRKSMRAIVSSHTEYERLIPCSSSSKGSLLSFSQTHTNHVHTPKPHTNTPLSPSSACALSLLRAFSLSHLTHTHTHASE